ncbi:MAG: phosphoribosylaminoimidazolesuccinocarboxamide synthase [ANME-2 cluster archaeon]|jgi:phosphoribosylaminoimidazole-succinocarboxamide synthase|nr:phosphoribosylaminoimidazolesuccinocarboxamide synthase [ANME-2 cluster archaeon]
MKKTDELYSGKAKTIYHTEDPNLLIMDFRDSLTAFDGEKKSEVPKKGYYNAQISKKLFELLEEKGIKTHYREMVAGNEMLVDTVNIILVEVIVRNIAAGSMTRKYPFEEGQVLDEPVIVMDYKDDSRHDPMLNEDIAVALGLATREELTGIRRTALEINEILKAYMDERGLLLPDFKLEFGRRGTEVVLGDEISCDTCRLWDKETGDSLDKDVFRFDKGDLAAAYREVARRIVPEIFE